MRLLLSICLAFMCGEGLAAHADDQVRQVQEELRKRNLYFGDVDGRATQETISAVRRFQQRKGLPGDGNLTNDTLRALDVAAADTPLAPNTEPIPEGPLLRSDIARNVTPDVRAYLESHATGELPPVGEPPAEEEGVPGSDIESGPRKPPVEPVAPESPDPVPAPPETAAPSQTATQPIEPQRPAAPERAAPEPAAPEPVPPRPKIGDVASLTRPPRAAPRVEQPRTTRDEAAMDEAAARRYVQAYLTACVGPRPDAELRFYADRVQYFDHGTVDRTFIARDVQRFYERWPQRHYELLDCHAEPLAEGDWQVTFRIAFHYEGEGRRASGRTLNIFRLREEGGAWRFTSLREQRLRN